MNNLDYNIILINLDGFRRDKVDLVPSLLELKKKSFFFENMITAAPYTFASLHSIFTGLNPSQHGVNGYYNIFQFKKNEISSLPEILKKYDYYTSCDIISEVVIPKQGIDDWNIFDEKSVNFASRHTEFIKKLANKKKFFLFLHYTEVHKHLVREIVQKYKQEENDDEFFNSKEENNSRFNSYIPGCENYLSTIFNTLNDCNLSNNTIVIILSDHGTSIGEQKGEKFYGVFTYDYTIRVPCYIYVPNTSPKIIPQQCSTIDVFPSILDFIGIKLDDLPNGIDGQSLIPLINNSNLPERAVFVETGGLYGPWPSPKKHNVFCLRKSNYKLIYNDTPQSWEFYDLQNDPEEIKNIYEENNSIILEMKKQMKEYFQKNNIQINLI
jgi:arylsulfatase A-like enzyme